MGVCSGCKLHKANKRTTWSEARAVITLNAPTELWEQDLIQVEAAAHRDLAPDAVQPRQALVALDAPVTAVALCGRVPLHPNVLHSLQGEKQSVETDAESADPPEPPPPPQPSPHWASVLTLVCLRDLA